MRSGAAVALVGCVLVSCRPPWTIRKIEAQEPATDTAHPFDAAAYAASIWNSKVVPAAGHGEAFAQARRAGHSVLVSGTGRVVRVDTARQQILLDIAPYDGQPDAEIPAGPIRGTALRDALPFIQFSQFINQVDFAHASNALDDRAAAVAAAVLPRVTFGTVLSFAGALDAADAGSLPQIVPVILTKEPGRQ